LDWHPNFEGKLVSGSFDKKACIWDIKDSSNSVKPTRVFEHESSVEDAKWFKKDPYLFATASQ